MAAQEIEKSITILPVCGEAMEKEAADRMSAARAPGDMSSSAHDRQRPFLKKKPPVQLAHRAPR